MRLEQSAAAVAAILNGCYFVRMLHRSHQAAERADALQQLGLIVREAFNAAEDFEPLFVAIVDGLSPRPRDF